MSSLMTVLFRNGDNLEITIEISPVQAVLGTSIEIETIDKRHIDLRYFPAYSIIQP